MGGGEANRCTGRSMGGMGGWGDGTEMVVPLALVVGARWTGDPVSGWIYRILSFSGGVSWWACLCGCASSVACGRKGHFRTCRELILVPCSCGLLTCSSVRYLPVSYLFWIFLSLPSRSIYGLIVAGTFALRYSLRNSTRSILCFWWCACLPIWPVADFAALPGRLRGCLHSARGVWCLLLTRVLMFSLRSHPLSWTFCLRRMQSSCRVRWWRRTTRTFWDSPIWPLDCRTA